MGSRGSKKAWAYENLKRRIINVELPPGLPINEAELAQQLQISKTPVREALRQLERDGLVENVPSRGSTISHITSQEISDVFQIREIIEAGAAKRAAAFRGNEELARQRDIYRKLLEEAPPNAEYAEWGTWEDLHLMIVKSLGNETLVSVYLGLIDRIKRIRNHYGRRLTRRRFQDIMSEHIAVLDTILAGHPGEAEQSMVRHLRNASAFLTGLAGGNAAFESHHDSATPK